MPGNTRKKQNKAEPITIPWNPTKQKLEEEEEKVSK